VWGYRAGSIKQAQYRDRVQSTLEFLQENEVPKQLRASIIQWTRFHQEHDTGNQAKKEVIRNLPDKLQVPAAPRSRPAPTPHPRPSFQGQSLRLSPLHMHSTCTAAAKRLLRALLMCLHLAHTGSAHVAPLLVALPMPSRVECACLAARPDQQT
jgi:isopenicillin N synthase-like dioxygenase